ncbi:class I SAM-dependent methyltransferase [Pelagibacteraceae bacterium]|nr:class I SAM-dependent methyltransferase [Pelagibacteraceae bacterium]
MKSFDPIWNDIYGKGQQLNKYPYSSIVSFIFSRAKPIKQDGSQTEILEIGCGAANNLWFAAREGFAVTGLDASEAALDFARQRFAEDGLKGKFDLGDFTDLPYSDDQFDIAFERSALNQTPKTSARKAVSEIFRVLKPGALFYAEISSDRGTARGTKNSDGLMTNVEGPYSGYGQVCFYSKKEIENLFDGLLKIKSLDHTETHTQLSDPIEVLAHWSILAIK